MFSPLQNTHMHIEFVYIDKVSTIANAFTHHQYRVIPRIVDLYNILKIVYDVIKQ